MYHEVFIYGLNIKVGMWLYYIVETTMCMLRLFFAYNSKQESGMYPSPSPKKQNKTKKRT